MQVYAGPAGLLLVLLLFLVLPAATASCSVPEGAPEGPGSISVSVTGADVVTGGDPDHAADGVFELSPDAAAALAHDAAPRGLVRTLGTAAVATMVLGMLTAFVRVWRLRAIVTTAVGALAAALLVLAEVALVGRLTALAEDNAEWLVHLPSARGTDVIGRASDVVSTGWGFWSACTGLVLIAAVNAALLLRPRRPPGREEDPCRAGSAPLS